MRRQVCQVSCNVRVRDADCLPSAPAACPRRRTLVQEIQRRTNGMRPALNGLEVSSMFRTLTTSLGMILLASSFGAAGQDRASTSNTATQSQQTTATKPSSAGQGKQTPANSQRKS